MGVGAEGVIVSMCLSGQFCVCLGMCLARSPAPTESLCSGKLSAWVGVLVAFQSEQIHRLCRDQLPSTVTEAMALPFLRGLVGGGAAAIREFQAGTAGVEGVSPLDWFPLV